MILFAMILLAASLTAFGHATQWKNPVVFITTLVWWLLTFTVASGQNHTTGQQLWGWAITPQAYTSLSGGNWTLEVAAVNAGGSSAPAVTTLCVPRSGHECEAPPPPPPPPPPPDCRFRGKSGKCK